LRRFSIQFIFDHLYNFDEALLQLLSPNTTHFKHRTNTSHCTYCIFSLSKAFLPSFNLGCLSATHVFSHPHSVTSTHLDARASHDYRNQSTQQLIKYLANQYCAPIHPISVPNLTIRKVSTSLRECNMVPCTHECSKWYIKSPTKSASFW
jgi:hypothetical protein